MRADGRSAGGVGRLAGVGLGMLLLAGCGGGLPRPMRPLDRALDRAGNARAPSLAGRWLALIAEKDGRARVLLVDVEAARPVPLPGLNRPDAQPLSVSVDAAGRTLALVRQRAGRTELVLHRRGPQTTMTLPLDPPGVPRRVVLRADGRELAVEVSREGSWQVDLVRIP